MVKNIYKNMTALEIAGTHDLSGKVALITGANSGIGYETTRALALHECHVVMACRNLKTANEAREKIIDEKLSAKITVIQLDLDSLESVGKCAKEFLQLNLPLQLLILNAGLMGPQKHKTDDGIETTLQVNHLSHMHLTNLLTEKLLESSPARVIVVSSLAHKYCCVHFRNPSHFTVDKMSPKEKTIWGKMGPYTLSKLCNILFTREFNKRFQEKGITAYCLHPGLVATNVFRNPDAWFGAIMDKYKSRMKTPEQGASTSVFLAVTKDIENLAGEYFINCKVKTTAKSARSVENAQKLWEVSESMIKDVLDRKTTEDNNNQADTRF